MEDEVEYRDLVLVNLQPALADRMSFDVEKFGRWLNNNGDDYIAMYYFYNGEDGDTNKNRTSEISEWFAEKCGIKDGFRSIAQDISTINTYFDGVLDTNYTDEEFINLFKYLIANNYDRVQNMTPDEIIALEVSPQFKEDLVAVKYKINVPHRLLKNFQDMKHPLIMGGLNHSTMRMFDILFKSIGKEYEKEDDFCF